MISSGADKTCVFRTIEPGTAGEGLNVSKVQRQSVQGGSVFDMAVDALGMAVVTVGQDKQISLWDVESGSRKKRYACTCLQ